MSELRGEAMWSGQTFAAHEENNEIRISLAEYYHCTGQFDCAIAQYEECLRYDFSLKLVRKKMAAVMMSQHKYHQAELILLSMIEEGGDEHALICALGQAIYMGHRWGNVNCAQGPHTSVPGGRFRLNVASGTDPR